jgi:hypothetical protein
MKCFHDLQDTTLMENQLISKLITLSPNLQTILIRNYSNTQIILKWLKELSFKHCKIISNFIYFPKLSFDDDFDPIFLYELSKLLPQLKTIPFSGQMQNDEENSTKLSCLIRYLREYFVHLIRLKLQMTSIYFNSQPIFNKQEKRLNEFMQENPSFDTIERRKGYYLFVQYFAIKL